MLGFFPFAQSHFGKRERAEQDGFLVFPGTHVRSLSLSQTTVVMTAASGTVVLVPN